MNHPNTRYSIFKLSNILFAWDILSIKEVIPLPPVTRIPNVSDRVIGVFNARGKILPLIDLRTILKVTSAVPCSTDMVMILQVNNFFSGILISEVITIIEVEIDKNSPVTTEDDTIDKHLLLHIHTDPDLGKIYLLDRDKIIDLINKPLTEI